MKSRRFQYEYRENASALHKKVGEILRSGIFANYRCYQEYPVSKVNPDYTNNRHHFDWVITDLMVVIEVMGEQHYSPANFGGISKEEALDNFESQKFRDSKKKRAALDVDWKYISIPYWDTENVDQSYILKRITEEI